ncbi:MAG: T9SS C-terminal target domain-containing protein [Ignavibacteriae bacterium]|nr:MAG: T9SS C-terminal target domain-containing protein [Ignavibacteriota bacterium]
MKTFLLLILFTTLTFSQDYNEDGTIDNLNFKTYDLNGDGLINEKDFVNPKTQINRNPVQTNNPALLFNSFWTSPAGAFGNCWDGCVGYFDSDTLLDLAGYTFSPAMFYVWEQLASRPDSFALVCSIPKAEGGGFGPMVFGDTDGDGKIEIILADFATFSRVYVYENDGNNNYVSQNTQTTMLHTNDGETAAALFIGDMNKNNKKEIICMRGNTSGGQVRVWEQTGNVGSNTYAAIYTYTTVSNLTGKGGFGDSDGDGWDEVFLTFGGFPVYNTFIRRIEFDSVSASFQHLIFEAPTIGFPASYRVYDFGNNGSKELLSTNNSNNTAASYIYRSTGPNTYIKVDSIFEYSDNNVMTSSDIKILTGSTQPSVIYSSFNSRIYVYNFNGTTFVKDYEKSDFPGAAIRRVFWLPWTGYDGYFNTWSSASSNGTFYLFKRDIQVGITNQNNTPYNFSLEQNYPNPFNPKTIISYQLPMSNYVKLIVIDIQGREIHTLVNERQNAGSYEVEWNASDYPSGIYFYKLTYGDLSMTRKMILIK